MNLKDRLTSTENLLRSIRSGEAFSSRAKGKAEPSEGAEKGSIWTRRISMGDVFSGLTRRSKPAEPAPAPRAAATPPQAAQPTASAAPPPRREAAPRPAAAPTFTRRPTEAQQDAITITSFAAPKGEQPAAPRPAAAPTFTPRGPDAPRAPVTTSTFVAPKAAPTAAPKAAQAAAPKATPPLLPTPGAPAAASAAPSAQHAAPKPKKALWNRQISFGRGGKSYSVGVSVSGPSLCLAAVRTSSGAIMGARRFPMSPDQAPGEKDFPAFLRSCMDSLRITAANADVWVVLRSSDLDLNVLSVPKLSGAKLDAAVYWTLQKEKKFAEAEYILDYQVMGPKADAKEPRLDVLTCLARRSEVERVRESFREAGFPLAGVTAIPNALLNAYRLPGGPKGFSLAANIHVEPDFSAIGLYTHERLLFSRFIRSGAGSMAETLVEHFQALSRPRPAPMMDLELPLSPGAAQAAPKPEAAAPIPPLDSHQAQLLLRHVLLGAPRPAFAVAAHLMSPHQMLEILSPAIERLARQVERTLDYYAGSQQVRCDVLHLSGDIFASPEIMQALAGELNFTPLAFDAASYASSGSELVAPADRMVIAPALTAALSQQGKCINLLQNYKVRTAREAKRMVTSSLVLGLAVTLLVIVGAGLMLDRANAEKRRELDRMRTQLLTMGPAVDENTLMGSVGQYKLRQDALREAALRLMAPAALAEITRRAPENVKILSLVADYSAPAAAKPGTPPPPGQAAPPQSHGTLAIEGVVTGSKVELDASLSRFVLNMQASPMFNLPVVDESGIRELGSGPGLYFVMHVGVK